MRINLHIELLVLEGWAFGARERVLVQAAVQAELSRLLTSDAANLGSHGGIALTAARGTPIDMATTAHPEAFGSAIAQSVHGVMPK